MGRVQIPIPLTLRSLFKVHSQLSEKLKLLDTLPPNSTLSILYLQPAPYDELAVVLVVVDTLKLHCLKFCPG